MTGCHKNPAWMAMLAGMMPTQGDLRSSSTCARFPTDVKLRAMSISAHNFGFLVVGALQFHRWTTLTSNFIEQLTENSSQSSQPQQVSGVIGENCFQVPLEVYHGRQILGKTGAQLLGTGISLYSPWKTIVKFVEGRRKSRRRSIVTAASTGDENDTSSANTITGYGIGSRSRNWTNIILGVNLLMFGAQIASQGQLLLLGAKVNSLIDKGQWWRFVTPSVLHANIMHLLVQQWNH